ncbi:endonuclease domain-containing protein [Bifidobacterium primatium]|nr:hypothetical protein [Bifidobacterium primatium]
MGREAGLRSIQQRMTCADAAERMGFIPTFSHVTALQCFGVQVPDDCNFPADSLHIAFAQRKARRWCKGMYTHYWSGEFRVLACNAGSFFITDPAMTWAQMANHVGEEGLIVIAGALTCRDPVRKVASLDDLERYVRDNPGFYGRSKCKAVLPFLIENSDSPPESILAVLIMREGLGRPVANFRIELPDGGYRLADLAYPDLKLAIEYQGAYHANPAQMRMDAARWNQLRALGWEIVFVTADDMRTERTRFLIVQTIRAMMHRQAALLNLSTVL